jgi:hypothetical protein
MGKLAVVERWQDAVNTDDADALAALSDERIEIVGPRGSGFGSQVFAEWLARAGLTITPTRWFCGPEGTVVVEQDAVWAGRGSATVASHFEVTGDVVVRYARYDSLDEALRAAGLDAAAEVTG